MDDEKIIIIIIIGRSLLFIILLLFFVVVCFVVEGKYIPAQKVLTILHNPLFLSLVVNMNKYLLLRSIS